MSETLEKKLTPEQETAISDGAGRIIAIHQKHGGFIHNDPAKVKFLEPMEDELMQILLNATDQFAPADKVAVASEIWRQGMERFPESDRIWFTKAIASKLGNTIPVENADLNIQAGFIGKYMAGLKLSTVVKDYESILQVISGISVDMAKKVRDAVNEVRINRAGGRLGGGNS